MPSETKRSKEDTWKESELKGTIEEINAEKERRRTKDRDRERRHDERRRDDTRKHRQENGSADSKNRERHENGRDRHSSSRPEKDRERDRKDGQHDRERETRHRSEREGRDPDERKRHTDRDRDRDRDRYRRHQEDKNRDKDGSVEKDKEQRRRERKRTDSKERDKDDRHRRDRGKDDREGRQERDSEGRDQRHRGDRVRDSEDRRHKGDREKDSDAREKRHRTDRERDRENRDRKPRSEKDKDSDDRDRKHRRDTEKDPEERRHGSDRERYSEDRDRRHKDKERNRRHRDEHDQEGLKEKDRDRRHRDKEREDKHRIERERDGSKEREEKQKHGTRGAREDRNRDGSQDRGSRDRHRNRDKDKDAKKRSDKDERKERDRDKDRDSHHRGQKKEDQQTDRERNRQDEHDQKKIKPSRDNSQQETSKKESKTEKSKTEKILVKEPEVEAGEVNEDDYNYEEDFDDYEDDDFEDDESLVAENTPKAKQQFVAKGLSPRLQEASDWKANDATKQEMDAVLQAMNEENERLLQSSQKSTWSDSSEPEDRSNAASSEEKTLSQTKARTFINFVSAKQRQISEKVSAKTKKRGQELLGMLELDTVGFELFDMPPVKEYEMYIRSFGATNTQQAYVQTNEDNLDREIQTDEIEWREKWSQHPSDTMQAVGGGNDELNDNEETKNEEKNIDSMRLRNFLQKSMHVVSLLLEEESQMKANQNMADAKQSNTSFSQSSMKLKIPDFLNGHSLTFCQFCPSQSNLLLTAYGKSDQIHDSLSTKGVICLWNIKEPSKPTKVLVCQAEPLCCCFSPFKATLVFAGIEDGSLLVWDLREPDSQHAMQLNGFVVRFPTYSTAGVLLEDNHQSPIKSIVLVVTHADVAKNIGGNENDLSSGLSFQVATLEQKAIIHMWVVAELAHADMAGSESDLGLSPGGRIKLLRSSSIKLDNPSKELYLSSNPTAQQMVLLPADANHFYVSTDSGYIIHGVRHGGRAPPKSYHTETENSTTITCIDFSPFNLPCFLAGCQDGSLSLYHLDSEMPIVEWLTSTNGVPIQFVKWSHANPSMFYVLDEESNIYIWDFNKSDAMPIKKEQYSQRSINFMDISNRGLIGNKTYMVLAMGSCDIEVHSLVSDTTLSETELLKFSTVLEHSY